MRNVCSSMNNQLASIVVNRSVPIPECGCWLWTGSIAGTGYGDFRMGRHYLAHRAAYEAFVGPIPKGMHVLHKCDVRSCVNPNHLFVGTNQENIIDSVRKGRRKGIPRNRPFGLSYRGHTKESREARRVTTAEQRESIKACVQSGTSMRAAAKLFGVSYPVVNRVVHGRYD